ncbi:MAG: TolC family protein [Treponema sp.]|nr:TolC family protein [Treponema sp.]
MRRYMNAFQKMTALSKRILVAATGVCFAGAVLSATEAAAVTQGTAAETGKTIVLTVDDAVEKALIAHLDVQRGKITLEQAAREYKHAWNSVLPSITASGSGSETRVTEDSDTDTVSLKAGVSASLSIDAGLGSKIKGLKASYEAGKATFEDTVRQTESAVRASFYNLLYLKEKWESAKSTCESYQRQYDQTSAKAKRGMASELDLLTAQVNLETAKPDVDSAEQTYMNALTSFLDTIGYELEPGDKVTLEGSLDYAETAKAADYTLLETCVEQSSEVRALEDKLRIAALSRDSQKGSLYFPSLTASASVYPLNWQNEKVSGSTTDTPNWSVSLGLSLPLDSYLPGSSARDTIASLTDTVKDYELQLENKKKTVRTETMEKLKGIELSQKNLKARHLNVELAQKSYEMTEDAYSRGTKDLLTLQSALDTLRTAQLQLREEQYTLISSVLDLEQSLSLPSGTLFTDTTGAETSGAETSVAEAN